MKVAFSASLTPPEASARMQGDKEGRKGQQGAPWNTPPRQCVGGNKGTSVHLPAQYTPGDARRGEREALVASSASSLTNPVSFQDCHQIILP